MNQRAFTLVELSVVLVIIGLLAGAILAGQSFIRAAQLRGVASEFTKYQSAFMTFSEEYSGLPGDLKNAQTYWGVAPSCPGDYTTPAVDSKTCNGDGNNVTNVAERYRFWQHLANAGLIEGRYIGVPAIAGTASLTAAAAGTAVPASKINSAMYQVAMMPDFTASNIYNSTERRHGIFLVGNASAQVGSPAGVLTPEETWNLDTKIDDGKPGNGKLMHMTPSSATVGACVSGTDPYAARYDTTNGNKTCAPYFMID